MQKWASVCLFVCRSVQLFEEINATGVASVEPGKAREWIGVANLRQKKFRQMKFRQMKCCHQMNFAKWSFAKWSSLKYGEAKLIIGAANVICGGHMVASD